MGTTTENVLSVGGEMAHPKVDPAALLVAVLTVGISPLTQSGPWNVINTIVALLVLAIVIAFAWPEANAREFRYSFALSLVLGFISGIASAYVIQWILVLTQATPCRESERPLVEAIKTAIGENCLDDMADAASKWCLGVGALAAALFLYWFTTPHFVRVRDLEASDEPWKQRLLRQSVRTRPAVDDGRESVATRWGRRIGLITYSPRVDLDWEVTSLEPAGLAPSLRIRMLHGLEQKAARENAKKLFISITNAETRALRKYQKDGYDIAVLHKDKFSRETQDFDGIKVRHELELVKKLHPSAPATETSRTEQDQVTTTAPATGATASRNDGAAQEDTTDST